MALSLRYAAVSDRGVVRKGNQDSVYAGPHLIAVADGMGGMAAGDLASAIVINTMRGVDRPPPEESVADELADTVGEANSRIRQVVDKDPAKEGMGTTLTALWFDGAWFHLVHIGDSRAYRLRGDEFEQLTMDDSYVQLLINEGRITPEEAETHPQRSLILRALGAPEVDPAFQTLAAREGDRLLLCSDGLSGPVSDDRIAEVMRSAETPEEVVQTLTQAAIDAGAPDNVSVLVADVVAEGEGNTAMIVDGAANDLVMANSDTAALPRVGAKGKGDTVELPAEGAESEEGESSEEDGDGEKPPRRKKSRVWRTVITSLVVLALLTTGGLLWLRTQYYLGVSEHENISLYRGYPVEIMGVKASWLEVESDRPAADAEEGLRGRLEEGLPTDSYDQGLADLEKYTDPSDDNSHLLPLCDATQEEAQAVSGDCRTS
ncbi:PP2C family protein-serine/threonine phosphatase [Salininema proteolyticum]|uniref:PP2C family protein-serine/threonine phosphatase n=1 Tax=Salininema proteolyticum TaxID=1607685 RepID=A0ABV8TWM2_9ACTN